MRSLLKENLFGPYLRPILILSTLSVTILFSIIGQTSWAAVIQCATNGTMCNGTSGDDLMVGGNLVHGLGGNDYIIGSEAGYNTI